MVKHWADKWPAWDDGAQSPRQLRPQRVPQHRASRVIDVQPPGLRSWFQRQSLPKLAAFAFLTFFVLPWAVLIFGILGAYLLSS